MENALAHIEDFVRKTLSEKLDKKYVYHNLEHTEKVVAQAKRIAQHAAFNEAQTEQLTAAAWLHDIGYVSGKEDHEQASESLAREILAESGYEPEIIQKICQAILDTKYPHDPQSEFGKFLCDADLSGVGSPAHFDTAHKLRAEMAEYFECEPSEADWLEKEIEFLEQHRYLTQTGIELYEEQKQKNINRLRSMLEDQQSISTEVEVQPTPKPKKKKAKAAKPQSYSRGVETMFRAGARTHINLSSMADSKANIMLSVNAMIVSVVLTVLVPKLDSNQHLIMPAVILIATCLTAMILATLSTRPVISKGRSSKEDIANKKSNLLFFGNFHDMDLEDYEDGMKQMMEDNDFLYGSLTRDMYFLGKVLNKKYRYLRWCYTIFMFGMVASVVAFGFALYTTPFV